jgi:hypothetical protein
MGQIPGRRRRRTGRERHRLLADEQASAFGTGDRPDRYLARRGGATEALHTAQSALALQQSAGNQAVAGSFGRRRRSAADDESLAGGQTAGGRSSSWGAPQQEPNDTLFGSVGGPDRRSSLFGREVQRYTTTDGVLANMAAAFGLGGPAAAATGAVTFDSSGFTASAAKSLSITKTGTDLTLDSATYTATGTVKASGPKSRVGDYEIGFLQTVYQSSRNFYYEPTGYKPGFLAQVAPTWFGSRQKKADTLTTLPVRDGDAGKRPWYGMETVDQFAKASSSTKSSTMDDTPGTNMAWTVGSGANQQHLVKTDGYDKFRSWLAVKDKSSSRAITMNYADWQVDYGTTITFNKATPGASVVTPTGTAGAKVTGTGDGSGGKTPLHNDPVANDVTTIVTTKW